MTVRPLQLGLVLAVCSSLVLTACHRESGEGEGVGNKTNLSVTVYADALNNCQQNLGATPTPMVKLNTGDTVTFQAQGAVPFDVEFPPPNGIGNCNSPFKKAGVCEFSYPSPGGAPVTTGGAAGPASTDFPYRSVTINGHPCNLNQPGIGPLGMRIRP